MNKMEETNKLISIYKIREGKMVYIRKLQFKKHICMIVNCVKIFGNIQENTRCSITTLFVKENFKFNHELHPIPNKLNFQTTTFSQKHYRLPSFAIQGHFNSFFYKNRITNSVWAALD